MSPHPFALPSSKPADSTSPERQVYRLSAVNRRRRMRSSSGSTYTIPSGRRFAGRISGGANRTQIYGTRTYGSGYPGESGRGTSGRGFPFIFWPIAWTEVPSSKSNSDYLIVSGTEYGNCTNSTQTRPGGPLKVSVIPSKSSLTGRFYLLGDEYTVSLLDQAFVSDCSTYLDDSFNKDLSNSSSGFTHVPAPEQVVQYYRASSLALALEGYNNSATYAPEGSVDTNLPIWTNTDLLDCLNETVGALAPLRSASAVTNPISSVRIILWFFVLLKWL